MNHIKFISAVLFVITVITFIGCVDGNSYTTKYTIINETDYDVRLLFYNVPAVGVNEFAFEVTKNGPGNVLERTIETSAVADPNDPKAAYEADSVSLIFDNERIQGHLGAVPDRSIMFVAHYEANEDGDDYIYRITEENFNNATPCDGPCK